MVVSGYRNLNLARKNPGIYRWSIAATPINKRSRAPSVSSPGKVQRHLDADETLYLIGCMPIISQSKLRQLRANDVREVCAWIVGQPQTAQQMIGGIFPPQWRRITFNPLSAARGGRLEGAYVWADTHEPVIPEWWAENGNNDAGWRFTRLDSSGAYVGIGLNGGIIL